MAIQFAETASVMSCAKSAFCSGQVIDGSGNNTFAGHKQAIIGGASGVAVPITVLASDAGHIYVWFECVVVDGSVWKVGTWTVRLDITLANSNVSWDFCDICRVNSSCVSQALMGNALGPGGLGATGVKSLSVGTAAQTPNAGDKVIILCTFSNIAGTNQQFQYTTDVNIDSPFDPPAPGQDAGRNWMYYNTSVRM